MAARPVLPKSFEDMLYKERKKSIEAAPLGKTDKKIASMYFLDEIPQIDIAVAVNMDRSAVSRRLPRIRYILERTSEKLKKR